MNRRMAYRNEEPPVWKPVLGTVAFCIVAYALLVLLFLGGPQ